MDTVSSSLAASAVQEPSLLSSLSQNTRVVGSSWIALSALLTTYSTTKFLKHNELPHAQNEQQQLRRQHQSLLFPSSTTKLPRSTLLTLSRFSGSLLLGLMGRSPHAVRQRLLSTIQSVPDFFFPALFLFVANYANSVSLSRMGISLTYTSKCAIPLMTVVLTVLLDGLQALPNTAALCSLVPIALGIACASWNSPTLDSRGFCAAMVSCVAQSALNVSSKRAMTKTGLQGPQAQRAMVAVGLVLATLLSLLQQQQQQVQQRQGQVPQQPPAWLTSMAVTSYHLEYCLSFMFVKLVAPITYGTCDAVRRLSIIVTGRCMFGGEPFSLLNLSGIGLALLGALSYSIASS